MEDKNKNKKRIWLIINAIFFILLVGLSLVAYRVITSDASLGIFGRKKEEGKATQQPKPEMTRRMIDGVYVPLDEENIPPIAVMIDNHIDARPPAGLAKANLVIEAEAEGGITRYLAVFAANGQEEKIGPVRSARPYFVDWARELSALYVHVGGSPEALVKMKQENVFHINEFYNEFKFWRDSDRFAPHNVFTSRAKLGAYLEENRVSEGKFLPWAFKDDLPVAEEARSNSIEIHYLSPDFQVAWQYQRETNDYWRDLAGEVHTDEDGSVITAKNILIQYAPAEETDDELRLDMHIIGEGDAVYCLDGQCREGSWAKRNATARTRFYDQDGGEIHLNAGTTWVEVIRPGYEVNY